MNIKKICILTNPESNRNKKGLGDIKDIISKYPDVLHFIIKDPKDTYNILRTCNEKGTDLLVINGGDGTIQHILTLMLRDKPFSKIPLVAILPAGSTNLIADNVGIKKHYKLALSHLLEELHKVDSNPVIYNCPTLKVTNLKSNLHLYGMFMGTHIIYKGSSFFNEKLAKHGLKGTIGVLITMFRIILALIFGDKYFTKDTPVDIKTDEKQFTNVNCLILIATTLKSLLSDIKLTVNNTTSEDLTCFFVKTHSKYLFRNILKLFIKKKSDLLKEENGYYVVNTKALKINGKFGFALDGELFKITDPSDTLTVEVNRDISFLTI